jgi:hypothetical protein
VGHRLYRQCRLEPRTGVLGRWRGLDLELGRAVLPQRSPNCGLVPVHLEGVASVAFTESTERTLWLESVTQSLWEGQVEDIIMACETLSPSCRKAEQAVTYFTNNSERMRYDKFRAAGYMIGSGTIESACKQIVTQRLKLPGAQWEVTGAVQTAKARAAWLSGLWEPLCKQRSALPLAI